METFDDSELTISERRLLKRLLADIAAGGRVGSLLRAVFKLALASTSLALAALHIWDWLRPYVEHLPPHMQGGD